MTPSPSVENPAGPEAGARRESFGSQNSQTAKEFIESQMKLEADAREVMPYSFDSCTQPLGPLRQSLFACITCNPPPATPDPAYTAAGICYSCSIACHGEHTLVELFNKRDFVCDCGTTRVPSTSPCTLRSNPTTGRKGVHSEEPRKGNKYNHNFQNRFCGCGETYDAHQEKGTMFQCLGLGDPETGGCGEDWWHPECMIGLSRDWYQSAKENTETAAEAEEDEETPLPPNFPGEDDFETFLCYKCVESNPWLKRYAGTAGFLPPVYKEGGLPKPAEDEKPAVETATTTATEQEQSASNPKKRKAEDDDEQPDPSNTNGAEPATKRTKEDLENGHSKLPTIPESAEAAPPKPKHETLPSAPSAPFSLFLKENFRDHFCRCPDCYPNLSRHVQLREEEDTYEPPLSENGDEANGGGSTGTGSLYDRGEAALNNIDRVRAIEGAMVYNHLRDKVKEFLKPFAESGTAVGAEDIKTYFEKLRGDSQPMQEAAGQASAQGGSGDDNGDGDDADDGRKEQSGY